MLELHPKVPLSELTHDLVFEITDLPGEVAEHYVRRAAIEMARNGNLLRRHKVICVQAGVPNYLVESLDEMDVVAIMSVHALSSCGSSVPVRRYTSPQHVSGCRGVASWLVGNEIHFQPVNCGDRFEVNFSVSPTRDACSIDRAFANEFYSTLLTNALAIAYALPDKPWSNPGKATALKAEARTAIQEMAVQTMTGGQRGLVNAKRPWVV